jgi:hypothetical protein
MSPKTGNSKKIVSQPFENGFRCGLKRSISPDVDRPPHPSIRDSDHAECGGVYIRLVPQNGQAAKPPRTTTAGPRQCNALWELWVGSARKRPLGNGM